MIRNPVQSNHQMNSRGRVCFHAPSLYPILSCGAIEFVGGAEMQLALITRGLAHRGFEISIVTCDYGQPSNLKIDGIRLLKSYPPSGGVPILRFFHPRRSRSMRALLKADAEVYYARGIGIHVGETYEIARWKRASFVLGTANDSDVDRNFPRHPEIRARWWARRALDNADAIIAQNRYQRRRYLSEFGRESEVIPNLVEIPETVVDAGQPGAVIWLGTYKPSKRPEWFTNLAKRLPHQRFVMCGFPTDHRETWEAAQAVAREQPNLEVRGFMEHNHLQELFGQAALFVHTSPSEGFPNTLLEAWAHGLPCIAAVDPDEVIQSVGLGEVVGSFEELERAVRHWLGDPALRRAAGEHARAYVLARHSPDDVLELFGTLLDRMVEQSREMRRGT
jgi:glycosyltransferase involved in cell wall biosynthesis